MARHMFETTLGDELSYYDLRGTTYKVVETYVDMDEEEGLVFTHRIEPHLFDDQVIALIEGGPKG